MNIIHNHRSESSSNSGGRAHKYLNSVGSMLLIKTFCPNALSEECVAICHVIWSLSQTWETLLMPWVHLLTLCHVREDGGCLGVPFEDPSHCQHHLVVHTNGSNLKSAGNMLLSVSICSMFSLRSRWHLATECDISSTRERRSACLAYNFCRSVMSASAEAVLASTSRIMCPISA